VELLVVISIISLLLAIIMPSFRQAKKMGRDTICRTNLRSIFLAQSLYLNEYDVFQPLNNELDDGAWQYNYVIYDGKNWENNFGPLVRDPGLISEPELLYCPFQKWPSHRLATSQNPWPARDGIDTRAGYARRFGLSGKSPSRIRKTIAIFSDLIHVPGVVKSAHGDGVNTVFADGHVSWVPGPRVLTHNELGLPFDRFDNETVEDIWRELDKKQ
jgi:prepilin-type processing-associated H-X9-DG protein